MKNKRTLFFLAFSIAFFLILVSYSSAYQVERRETSQDVDEMTEAAYLEHLEVMQLRPDYNPVTEGYIIDAPWKVQSSNNIFPLLTIADDSVQLYPDIANIYVCDYYEHPNCDMFVTFSNWNVPQVITSNNVPFFYTFYLDKNNFREINGNIAIKVKFDLNAWWLSDNWEGPIYIIKSAVISPKLSNWYCGDTHYHSKYTNTNWLVYGEFGAPVDVTINSGEVMGLDWLTVTDHSNSFGEHSLYWNLFKGECLSNSKCLIGEEVNSDPEVPGVVLGCESLPGNHILAFDINSALVDNGCSNVPPPLGVISNVYNQGGFVYAAHPESDNDVVEGIGTIITKWNDYSLRFNGLEIWNGDIKENLENRQALDDGLTKWKELLLNGRKVFISAGSDAHGDLNEKFGKEMICVYAPFYSKENIFNGLKNGNSYMTNNGALIFSINGKKIGETTSVPASSQINLDINYNVLDACVLQVYRGQIGSNSESQIGSSVFLNSASVGSLTKIDIPVSDSYYRIECISTDGKSRIYTNPIWVDVEGGTSTQRTDFIAKLNRVPHLTCVDFTYWIDLGNFNVLPDGMAYVAGYPVGSNHVKVSDIDGKIIDLQTYDDCTSCGVVPTCTTSPRFSDVIYNGFSLIEGSCTTTSAQTEICWESADKVKISRSSNQQVACSSNSDCGNPTTSPPYCNPQGNACSLTTTYTCNNPGTPQSFCTNSTNVNCNACQYGCFEGVCNEPPPFNLIINAPSQNLFNDRRVQINLTINQEVDKIAYTDLADVRPREITLCSRNCIGYGYDRITTKTFGDGWHELVFKAIKDNMVVDEERVSFVVDSRVPRILKTEPRRGFASGLFYVEFSEDNPTELILYYGNRNENVNISEECFFDRNRRKCETEVNLSGFNGQEISYWFRLRDVAGNIDTSRVVRVEVDTAPPEIVDFSYDINRRRVDFVFGVNEPNFDEINYIDWSDSRPREIRLCSRLRNGVCEARRSFRNGWHNLTIQVLDEAGNFAERNIGFNI